MVVLSVLYVVPPHDFDFSKVAILLPLEMANEARGRCGKRFKHTHLKSRLSSKAFSRGISVPSSWFGAKRCDKVGQSGGQSTNTWTVL